MRIGVIIFALFEVSLFSQISIGGDTELKFGESKNNFNFSEVFLNLNLSSDLITTWAQFEYSAPPELGKSTNGLRKFRLDYADGPLELSIGDIYKIWGRGLILNQFDDQNVNLDNGYRGLSFGIIDNEYAVNLIAGRSKISRASTDFSVNIDNELRVPNHSSNHSIFGGDLEVYNGSYNLGLSFFQSRQEHPVFNQFLSQIDTLNLVHRTHGLRAGYDGSSLSGYLEFASKSSILPFSAVNNLYADSYTPFNGFSLFSNLNYYFDFAPLSGWSFMIEYKNYNLTKINPDEKDDFIKNFDMNLIFTQPPTVMREHSSVLLARMIPQVNFSDEVGYQLALVGPVSSIGYFTLNYQTASRTNEWYKEIPDSVNAVLSSRWNSDSSLTFLPYESDVALPYNELYLEMEGYLNNLRYQIGFAWTKSTPEYHALYNSGQNSIWDFSEPFNDANGNGTWDEGESFTDHFNVVNERLETKYKNAFTIPTLFNYKFISDWSLDLKYEFQKLEKGTIYKNTLSANEFFDDLDGDGIWDPAEEFNDLDGDGVWDAAEQNWYDWWLNGWITDDQLPDYDLNGNGIYDEGEQFSDSDSDGIWDPAEEFNDLDGDGIWDAAEEFNDVNNDNIWTPKGIYVDSTKTDFYKLNGNSEEKISEKYQYNHMITIGLGRSPHWSLSLTVESSSTYEYGPKIPSIINPLEKFMSNFINLDNKWIALDLMINLNENTRLDIMYGTLRGGIICSNGICRYVEPFDDGFKLTLTSVF